MTTYDLGGVVTLTATVTDVNDAPANAGAMVCTLTVPDGTTSTPGVSNPATGIYTASLAVTVAGLYGVRWVATGANAGAFADSFTVMDGGTPLLSLAEIKDRLNITATTHDAELRRVAAAATARAAAETHRALSPRVLAQSVDMDRKPSAVLVVPTPALLSVTGITADGVTVAPGDYTLDPTGQVITRAGSYWSGDVVVTGVVGVAGDDLAIAQQAVLELTAHLWETQRVPMGRNTPNAPTPGMGHALPWRVTEMLESLRLDGFA